MVVSEAVYVLVGVFLIAWRLKVVPEFRLVWRLLPAWAGLVGALMWLRPVSVFVQAPVAICVYLGLLWVFRAMGRSDWALSSV